MLIEIGFKDSKEAVARTCSIKKVFLEISQNSQENTCARVSFLIKLQATFFYRTPLVAASNSIMRFKKTFFQLRLFIKGMYCGNL